MDRRRFIGALSGLLATPLLYAQAAERVYHIGWLDLGVPGVPPSTRSGSLEAFRRGLGELGWIEGRNVVIETRYANDHDPGSAGSKESNRIDSDRHGG